MPVALHSNVVQVYKLQNSWKTPGRISLSASLRTHVGFAHRDVTLRYYCVSSQGGPQTVLWFVTAKQESIEKWVFSSYFKQCKWLHK